MTREEEILFDAKRNIRQGIQSNDIAEGAEYADKEEGANFLLAVAAKMNELVAAGYEPEPLPALGNPKHIPDGNLRFLANDDAMRQRAETAFASQAVESWVFFNGEEDEKVMGRVTSTEPVHGLLYFTVQPAD